MASQEEGRYVIALDRVVNDLISVKCAVGGGSAEQHSLGSTWVCRGCNLRSFSDSVLVRQVGCRLLKARF